MKTFTAVAVLMFCVAAGSVSGETNALAVARACLDKTPARWVTYQEGRLSYQRTSGVAACFMVVRAPAMFDVEVSVVVPIHSGIRSYNDPNASIGVTERTRDGIRGYNDFRFLDRVADVIEIRAGQVSGVRPTDELQRRYLDVLSAIRMLFR